MKHLLILIVAAALYFHFYPNEQVTNFYQEKITHLKSFFSEVGNTSIRLKSDKIYSDLEGELASFSEKEIERLKVITSSRDVVREFYHQICQTNQRDIIFHIKNEKKVCNTISHYSSML
ncbi:MAG: hypothetical protein GY928_03550 [Colwellia sp.]|nr:hypothetical protein [Colwellia sp.]